MKRLFENTDLVVEFDEAMGDVVIRNKRAHKVSIRVRDDGRDLTVSSTNEMTVSVERSGVPAIRVVQH